VRRPIRPWPALLAAALLALSGCGQLPTAPAVPSIPESSQPSYASAPAPEIEAGARSSRTIVGLLSGTLSAGDFTVIIPPAAFSGKATVTVHQPDLSIPVVDLSITPASANRFRLPVLLIGKASRVQRPLLSLAYISYYNEATARWERVPGSTVNILNLTVQAPLWHFSKYRIELQGRAGW
jgi:hypothetical protein